MGAEVILALPPKAASILEQLCEQANKQTGIGMPKDFERFCKFTIVAHEQGVDLPEDSLRTFLEEHGWAHEAADAAAKRYRAACLLLGMYDKYRTGDLEI